MKITEENRIGQFPKMPKAPVKTYRAAPGNLRAALGAAYHYAKRNDATIIVVPGNSYGSAVYHLALERNCLRTFVVVVPKGGVPVHMVDANGVISKAVAG